MLNEPSDRDLAKSLFKFSILYMLLLSVGMVVDSWPVTRSAVAAVSGQLKQMVSQLPF